MKIPISRWFNANDEQFEAPFKALAAGYTLTELMSEYERTFTSQKYTLEQFANDYALWIAQSA